MAGMPRMTESERRAHHLQRKRTKYKVKHPDHGYPTRLEALAVHSVVYHCNICKQWHTSTKKVAGGE